MPTKALSDWPLMRVMKSARPTTVASLGPQSKPGFPITLIWIFDPFCMRLWLCPWSSALVNEAPAFLPAWAPEPQATEPSLIGMGEEPNLWPLILICPSWDPSHTPKGCLLGSEWQRVATEQGSLIRPHEAPTYDYVLMTLYSHQLSKSITNT